MNKMEKIIAKAIEGGYNGARLSYGHIDWEASYTEVEIVLDSLFWQALGKACGWGKSDKKYLHIPVWDWKGYALKFHEINLTEGMDKAVEYLLNLIEKN